MLRPGHFLWQDFREDDLFIIRHARIAARKGEKIMEAKTTVQTTQKNGVKVIVQVGMLAAVSIILMMFEFPLPFAPSFYEIDLSEVPVMVGCFALGPLAGAAVELVKILLNLVVTGTDTAGVGELANFVIGCCLCVPAGIIYKRNKTRKNALIGMITGVVIMTVAGCFINAFVLLPVYATAFGTPIDALVGMGTAINPAIDSVTTFVIFAVAPFNLLKGVIVSVIVFLIYKKISPVFRMH